jgi:hypothetical protein
MQRSIAVAVWGRKQGRTRYGGAAAFMLRVWRTRHTGMIALTSVGQNATSVADW